MPPMPCSGRVVFLFLYFLFSFFTKIYFCFRNLQKYTPSRPAAGRSGPSRPAAGRQGLLCKNFYENFCAQIPRGRSPGSGVAGLPGRPAAGRPALACMPDDGARGRQAR